MRHANEKRVGLTALLTAYLGGYFQETGTSPADLRDALVGDQPSLRPLPAARDLADPAATV